jgi:BirA family biotin operon repressor/biotin-[acetyl-CoA-carboxylase] ligase
VSSLPRKPSDKLDPQRIETAVDGSEFWQQLIYLEQIGSTNDVAKDLASQGAPEGTIVVCEEQTAGRGRMDRRWVAPPESSILCSILFRPNLSPGQAHRLTMLCSVAAADAVEEVTELPVRIKWPNDLIVTSRDAGDRHQAWRKLGGILTETGMTGGGLEFVVVGIGINVNVPPDLFPQLAPDATSLLAETSREFDRSALLVALLEGVELGNEQLKRGQSPREEWAARLATLGQRIRVATARGTLEGVAETVDADGALLLRTDDGDVHRLVAGDVTLAHA